VLPSNLCICATGVKHRTEREGEIFVQTTEEAEILKKPQCVEMHKEEDAE